VISPAVPPGPDPAERARTVLSNAPTSVLEVGTHLTVVLDVVAVDTDGSLVLLVPEDGPLAARVAGQAVPATVRSALVSPVPGPDRRLDSVTVHGIVEVAGDVGVALEVLLAAYRDQPVETVLRPDASMLLRLSVVQLRLDGEPVEPDAYARATADPLAAGSDEVVAHLLCAHPEQVLQLAHLLDRDLLQGAQAVAPVRVDRFGITFLIESLAGSRLTRLNFPAALRGPAELPAVMRELHRRAAQVTDCPFTGDPRGA
jgi:hypothetical protein